MKKFAVLVPLFLFLAPVAQASSTPYIGAVTSAGSNTSPICAGSIATVWGTNLGTAASPSGAPYPTSLGGSEVLVNGELSALLFVSPTQINFEVPWEARSGNTIPVEVISAGGSYTFSAIFTSGTCPAFFQNSYGPILTMLNGSVVQPGQQIAGGTILTAWVTGLGPTSPAQRDGQLSPGVAWVTSAYSISCTNLPGCNAGLQYVGAAPGEIGSAGQINIITPTVGTAKTYGLIIKVGGVAMPMISLNLH